MRVINHIEGLCDSTGKRVPFNEAFETSDEAILELAKTEKTIGGIVAVTEEGEAPIKVEQIAEMPATEGEGTTDLRKEIMAQLREKGIKFSPAAKTETLMEKLNEAA